MSASTAGLSSFGRVALTALEQGYWAAARLEAGELGAAGPAVLSLALSMRERALGLVDESWQALARCAAGCASVPQRRTSASPADPWPLPWPSNTGSAFWNGLIAVGRREEQAARTQWQRLEDADHPKRVALVEACIDHLTWVDYSRQTWRRPGPDDWLPANDRVCRGAFGDAGRDYYLRRANELHHWVHPLQAGPTRRVWDDVGRHRGLRELALEALAERAEGPMAGDRIAYTVAVYFARLNPGSS